MLNINDRTDSKKLHPRLYPPTLLILLLIWFAPLTVAAQKDTSVQHYGGDTLKVAPDGTEGAVIAVRKQDSATNKLPPNEFKGSLSTFKIGLGYIHDGTTYIQSEKFKQQMDSAKLDVHPQFKIRDFRILGSGVLNTKRYIAWKFAYMYDGDKDVWMLRESGITIGVPELKGNFFIGRTKEGFSMVKVMNGHSPWTMERQMAIDVIPILADGIKYMGFYPKSRIFTNLAVYSNATSKNQSFATFELQGVARVGWLAINDNKNNTVLHIAANLRYAKPKNGEITLKSRPESNPTPQILNTGVIEANQSSHIGYEIYYRHKDFMIGSEAMVHSFYSDEAGNHQFYGGDVVVSYFFTHAIRPYASGTAIFGFVPVKKSIFKGGLGEIEGVVHLSTLNLNNGTVKGGQFWRLTPMVNWYMSRIMRMEFVYGYGVLDRYGIKGPIQFFETRLQFTVM
jgi:phosphate-selective porin OprO and OprP